MAGKTPHLGQLLLRAYYWMDEGIQHGLQEKGWPKVTHAQSMLISSIGEGITRPADIAKHLDISRQAVHQSLNDLIKLNIVELVRDPHDGRAKQIQLTPSALTIVQDAQKAYKTVVSELGRRLGPDLLRDMRKALEQDWGAAL